MKLQLTFIRHIALFVLLSVLGLTACNGQPKKTAVKTDSAANSTMMAKPDSFWKRVLSSEEYRILREKGTERPFSGKWLLNKDSGTYTCAACGHALFSSDAKFDSDCGWPSFDAELESGKIIKKTDLSLGMERTEILCGNCGGHLGHLFDDGPTKSGKRYCVNSVSIDFLKQTESGLDSIILGGGCFWCIEAVFEEVPGVVSAVSGYSGGHRANPDYASVCSGETGHAEVVKLVYDRSRTSLSEILNVFFTVHDPTTFNRQGADEGSQYRSVIVYRNPAQKALAEAAIKTLKDKGIYADTITTELLANTVFYPAEDYHQDYFRNNPDKAYCSMVIRPKLDKFRKQFKTR